MFGLQLTYFILIWTLPLFGTYLLLSSLYWKSFGATSKAINRIQNSQLINYLLIATLIVFGCFLSSPEVTGASGLSLEVWKNILQFDVQNLNAALVFQDLFFISTKYTNFFIFIAFATTLFLVASSSFWIGTNSVDYSAFLLFALFFMSLLIFSYDLFGVFVAIEGLSLTLYIITILNYKSKGSIEAVLTYFTLGALASGILAMGIALIYNFAESSNFWQIYNSYKIYDITSFKGFLAYLGAFFVIFGLLFKISAFPGYFWTPVVYGSVPWLTTMFFSITVKMSILSLFIRLLYNVFFPIFDNFLQNFLIVIAVLSIFIGCIGAIMQTELKRFVGYTSINQVGFILLGLSTGTIQGVTSTIFFLIIYISMNFLFFSFFFETYTGSFKTNRWRPLVYMNDLYGLGRKYGFLTILLVVSLFSMAGIPPLAGFFSKFYILWAFSSTNLYIVTIVIILLNVVSVFYYLRLIKIIFFKENISRYKFRIVKIENLIESDTFGKKQLFINSSSHKGTILWDLKGLISVAPDMSWVIRNFYNISISILIIGFYNDAILNKVWWLSKLLALSVLQS